MICINIFNFQYNVDIHINVNTFLFPRTFYNIMYIFLRTHKKEKERKD